MVHSHTVFADHYEDLGTLGVFLTRKAVSHGDRQDKTLTRFKRFGLPTLFVRWFRPLGQVGRLNTGPATRDLRQHFYCNIVHRNFIFIASFIKRVLPTLVSTSDLTVVQQRFPVDLNAT
ncbi:hypothetical protein PAXRUDRAFT_833099 [Paxillus rubicundulus Ve08.2h10]|uniref:Uncharacterized protein n=1 Tax=Paxillus rubicundulus Ve08.2h10 TaxID=930991 RepID=A0A0D0CEG7_9AGAM|nr:hypothetical protein PAXRUDRAFT_833099 [Paxillus rubicundulus Ve08.2h10]